MDFNDYVNQLNQLDSQETRAELENYYAFNSGLMSFFTAIDNQVKAVMNSAAINPKSVALIKSQVDAVKPLLNKLKFEISMLDAAKLSVAHKGAINKTIDYIKGFMEIGEVDITANQFFALLQENKTAYANEQAQRAKEEAERKAKEERERKEREEKERIAREEAERKAREERERKEREEAERKAKEERERKEREEKERIDREEAMCKTRKERERVLGIAKLLGLHIEDSDVQQFFSKFGIERRDENAYKNKAIIFHVYNDIIKGVMVFVTSDFIGNSWGKYEDICFPYNIKLWDKIDIISSKIGRKYDEFDSYDGNGTGNYHGDDYSWNFTLLNSKYCFSVNTHRKSDSVRYMSIDIPLKEWMDKRMYIKIN